MANYIELIKHPQINHELFFKILSDFRKGGLNPDIWNDFIAVVRKFEKNEGGEELFQQFKLVDISQEDFIAVHRELGKRSIEKNKKCWHPEASNSTCEVVSAAHSIQNNGVLSQIAENGHVMTIDFKEGLLTGSKPIGKKFASIFWGFCNKHDAIFRPIEVEPYTGSDIQNFLFAYRAFVVSSHKKCETSALINFGEQSDIDTEENINIFNDSILSSNYKRIKTHHYELPLFYPTAVSSSFYLDFDFNGNKINHSDDRMEYLFFTVFPERNNKTHILISYFEDDEHLYKDLAKQITDRNNLKYDISILIAGHCENVYYNPAYYNAFIQRIELDLLEVLKKTQYDIALLNNEREVLDTDSLTPHDYLNNPWRINVFGY
ncbi:MAG: hypothetical protein AB7S75_24900 [Desulfococcaceae bacterium]